ncbi:MAG: hypothetical protein NUV56_04090 [Candidatus Uhrbacteria bacterium]|nr:hypothetical protein [Candidatus Uhrbacteria bacterium]
MKRGKEQHEPASPRHEKRGHEDKKTSGPVSEDALKEGLEVIYGEDRDDLHVVERGSSPLTRWLTRAVGVLAVLTALAFTGYFVYASFFAHRSQPDPLTMEFEVQDTLISGERASIVLHYANPTSVPLASLEIDINLPTTFRLLSSDVTATNAEELVWDIGSISAHSDGKITLEGIWIAEVPSSTALQALANYKPANFNSSFHEIASATVATNTSTATVVLTGPEKASPGVEAAYSAVVTNTGSETLSGAELELVLPDGFFVTQTNPVIEGGADARWLIGELAPLATLTYTFSGTFASDVSGLSTIGTTLGVSDGVRMMAQSTSSVFTDVAGSSLQLNMVVNGATGDVSADPGSLLRISLRVQNTGTEVIKGVTALLDFQSEGALPITWSGAVLDGGRVTAAGIVYDADVIGDLDPEERVLINLALPLKADVETAASSFSLVLSGTANSVTVQAAPIEVTLNSDASLRAEARYFDEDGVPLGSGPLPPVVGRTTSYRVVWTVTNGLHDLENITISATLPDGVVWDNFSTADLGSVGYDEGTRAVRWSIATLPDDVQQVDANFSVSVVPTEENLGTYITLTSGSLMRGTDVQTDASLERSADELTTELAGDAHAEGKGIVIE